ncbi:putative bifunctional diguanylate cyclase/phosphodiesterase [Thalassotalea euphylliae]|uniref:Bifunctional diguanylate cyclase/phosphodiesterase n=1 Tax=Thalassotalea euphylliae TaxID=1655234 RepID=A0A3E0UAV9_9GAMM|nr:bifunctional diguanylate cyclase/phosphodiesterase [Thalassotalea euphylliae]REL34066.1 bifunctional diguanylate cyclase/phosphodiesterase [Thalassotalea euphylliae]
MNEQLVANTFLYLTNAIVFGVLSFLLWQFYRGFGSKHVRLWQFSLQALTTSQLAMCVKAYTVLSSPTSLSQVLLEGIYQSSYFVFVCLFLIGLYIAQTQKSLARKHIVVITGASFLFAWLITLIYAFADGHVYDRFFMRETVPQFLFGIAYIGMAFFSYRTPPAHVSSRIMQISFVIYGLRYFVFSMLSTVMIAEVWFSHVIRFFNFFDIGSHAVIGFSMLIWMQGAERATAKSATNKAQYLGRHDSLTGSLNREQVMEKMPELMRTAGLNGKKLSIFLLDIKRFKFVNDTYGLKTGDFILGEIARRLRDSLFQPQIVGRLSGDSFVYVFEFEQRQQIPRALSHLHELIARPYQYDGQDIMLQCSIGYSFYPEHAEKAETLLQLSNLALFHAESRNEASKQYSDDMQVQGRHLLAMEKAIKLAMERDEFELYFQPQLNLLTNKLEGVEALIRWNHPTDGLLSPDRFLPDIDALALNSVFDNYVLDKACRAIARWHQAYHRWITVAVNITAVEFQDPKFVSKIQTLLLRYDLPPNYLELEITENVVMTDLQSAMDTIVELQTMGIKVSIDDFGTGYSSLAYLRNLPIDKIKIDRSFVNEMAENDSDLTIVKSMVRLSHGLGKRVLAEGVETQTQLDILRTLNCDAVQGYFISKPICEADLVKYFKR